MKANTLIIGTSLALAGWFALAPARMLKAAPSLSSYQVAQNQWYQGQRGEWHRTPHHKWQWRPAEGDEWYQGVQGHWYLERHNKWRWIAAERREHEHEGSEHRHY